MDSPRQGFEILVLDSENHRNLSAYRGDARAPAQPRLFKYDYDRSCDDRLFKYDYDRSCDDRLFKCDDTVANFG